jgi:hypothetical protein
VPAVEITTSDRFLDSRPAGSAGSVPNEYRTR